jgi:membrane-associated protease RseP (regulator of RpoE activity)
MTGDSDDRKEQQPQTRSRQEIQELERIVQSYLVVQGSRSDHESVEFEGRLRTGPEETASALERLFPRNKLTLLEGQNGTARIVLTSRGTEEVSRDQPKWWLQIALFLLTILTTTWVGASSMGVDLVREPSRFSVGLPFSLGLLAILSAHEFGHYFAARRNGMTVTLPYFIPVPVSLGTFGAFIGLKSRAPNQKALFDVAVAGPLAGLIVAVPVLLLGLQNSLILNASARVDFFRSIGLDVGSSIMLATLSKLALGGALLEGHRVILDPLALAGWFGMIITALNLLPIGQLDGGYIAHAVLGAKRANAVSIVGLIAVFLLAFFVSSDLLMWAFVIFFVGSARDILPADGLTRVGPGRTALGYLALALLLLILVPVPAYFYQVLKIHSPFA